MEAELIMSQRIDELMQKLTINDDPTEIEEKDDNLESHSSSIDTVIQRQNRLAKLKELLLHVVACRIQECQYERCEVMKICFRHVLTCKNGPGGCLHCTKIWRLIRAHSLHCRGSQCTVLKCRYFKEISTRQQQQREAESSNQTSMEGSDS